MSAQGSQDWHLARLGKITASQFKRVLAGPQARASYRAELEAAREAQAQGLEAALAYLQATHFSNTATEWGNTHEPRARAAYELLHDLDVEQWGFRTLPGNPNIGASVDGYQGAGIIEIKCPLKRERHIRACRDGMPAEHIPQVQGCLWVTHTPFCDFISFDPEYRAEPLYVERVERDEGYIEYLAAEVRAFETALATGAPLPEYDPADDGDVPALF